MSTAEAQREYDIIVLGSGPGGYTSAIQAAKRGASVALVEADLLGGTCLNRGCIPTKALLHVAETWQSIQEARRIGIHVGGPELRYDEARKFKDRVVSTLRRGVESLMKSNKVDVYAGFGVVENPRRLRVEGEEEGTRVLTARRGLLLDTGSVPKPLPIPGLDLPGVVDSTGALEIESLPARAVVIGAGAVGIEFAHLWAVLGSRVTLVEMLDRVLPAEDAEVSQFLHQMLKRNRVDIRLGTRVAAIEQGPEGLAVRLVREGAEDETVTADLVLVAVGREASLKGVENLNLALERGFIRVDDRMETSVPGVYAVGDAVGGHLLAHVATWEGEVAIKNLLGEEERMDYRAVPRAVYTSPEVASVGATEEELQKAGVDYRVGRFPFAANGKALAADSREGWVKVLAGARFGEVLGVHICGDDASNLIGEATLAMRLEATVEEIMLTIHPHPTRSEAFLEAAADVLGLSVHKP